MQFFSPCDFRFNKQCNLAIYVSHLCAKNDFNDSKIVSYCCHDINDTIHKIIRL